MSGIGFLGAGSILLRGQVVKGLTTAASVWSVAALGLAAGGGLYFADALATGIILLILIGIKPLEEAYRSRLQSAVFSVLAERGSIEPDRVKKAPRRPRQPTPTYRHDPGRGRSRENKLHLTMVSQRDIRLSVSQLKDAPGFHSVEVEKRNAADTE